MPVAIVLLTVVVCGAGLLARDALRARYAAWRLVRAGSPAERAARLGEICAAGTHARWAVAALMADDDAEVRQYGVLALHHCRFPWARRELLDALDDPDEYVRRLAAVGLAIHGDSRVIPHLEAYYRNGDTIAAQMACLALERMGTGEAVASLHVLAGDLATPERRAALVDALDGIGTPACAWVLLTLLDDDRPCLVPTREQQAAAQFAGVLREWGGERSATRPAGNAGTTVAERAARALAGITRLEISFSSDQSSGERAEAIARWRAWVEDHVRAGDER